MRPDAQTGGGEGGWGVNSIAIAIIARRGRRFIGSPVPRLPPFRGFDRRKTRARTMVVECVNNQVNATDGNAFFFTRHLAVFVRSSLLFRRTLFIFGARNARGPPSRPTAITLMARRYTATFESENARQTKQFIAEKFITGVTEHKLRESVRAVSLARRNFKR